MQDNIKQIANHFGEETQKRKLHEECCELIVADSLGNKEDITQEMADVMVVILGRAYQNGITIQEIEEQMEFKVNRTLTRIEEGYYER